MEMDTILDPIVEAINKFEADNFRPPTRMAVSCGFMKKLKASRAHLTGALVFKNNPAEWHIAFLLGCAVEEDATLDCDFVVLP